MEDKKSKQMPENEGKKKRDTSKNEDTTPKRSSVDKSGFSKRISESRDFRQICNPLSDKSNLSSYLQSHQFDNALWSVTEYPVKRLKSKRRWKLFRTIAIIVMAIILALLFIDSVLNIV